MPKLAWDYTANEFYHPNVQGLYITKKYLVQARTHLESLVLRPDGWNSHGFMLARVQYLLEEPNEMVEATFETAVKWKKEEKKKVELLQHFGWFYGMIGNNDRAREKFEQAVQLGFRLKHKPYLAYKGLNLLKKRLPLYIQIYDNKY